MEAFALFLKSYADDLRLTERFLDTFHRFNQEGLTLYLSVPDRDYSLFSGFRCKTVQVILDEEITEDYFGRHSPMYREALLPRVALINAWVTRLAFWEMGLAYTYYAVDADLVFLRPFGIQDFLSPDMTPYAYLSEYRELAADPFYFERYWKARKEAYLRVKAHLDLHEPRDLTALCCMVMSGQALSSFRDTWLAPRGWTYGDALAIAEYDYFWYAAWLQKSDAANLLLRDNPVLVVQHQGHHLALVQQGITKESLAEGYLGVIVNSNWSKQYGLVDFDSPPENLYRTQGEWATWLKRRTRRH